MAEYNFLNDITKFGNNALSAANTLQRQVRAWVTEQVEYLIKSMELTTKDDFAAFTEAQNKKITALETKIAALEKLLAKPTKTSAKTEVKPAKKKAAAKQAK